MSERKHSLNIRIRTVLGIIAFVAVVYLIIHNAGFFGNVVLVLLGFGAVILVHEFGHFVVAKLCGIKIEAFSIFMPPILFGVQRTEKGLRFRILPELFPKEDDESAKHPADKSGEGLLSFTIGKKNGGSGTEYRIGLIPFGGFVKMLGQGDVEPVKESSDPRSFTNKPFIVRASVLAAGVTFNALSAVIIFMVVFLVGINLTPAVVGGVKPNSPAARAGLKAGDEIIEIGGKSDNLDFINIGLAAALSDVNEVVRLKVKREDGSTGDFALVAKQLQGEDMKTFGILPPMGLTIARLSEKDANELYARTGLRPGDRIKSVGGRDVRTYWELAEIVRSTLTPATIVTAERTKRGSKNVDTVQTQLGLLLPALKNANIASESALTHIYSMVPRLRLDRVGYKEPAGKKTLMSKLYNLLRRAKEKLVSKLYSLFGKTKEKLMKAEPGIKSGDIILAIGDVNLPIGEVKCPTYKEFREVTTKYRDAKMPVRVLRRSSSGSEEPLTITVEPKWSNDANAVLIGISPLPVLDTQHPVVAKTIDAGGGLTKLEIPRGATITAVDGTKVSSFYDIIREIGRYSGERITIDYRLNEEVAGDVALNVGSGRELIAVESGFAEGFPFEDLERCYKARGADLLSRLVNAVVLGCEKTVTFIAVTYVTLKRIVGGLVSPRNLVGPVGIITLSYHIVAEQPLVYYVYFLGLISAVIAVFNFLPLPPFDGGLIVILLVEKIKGSALSERTQGVIMYAGWVLVGALLIYVTFNDIIRSIFG
jgi:regulator of sigma E protease